LRGELDCGSVNDTVTNETVPENGKRKVVKICPNKTPDNKCARDPIGEGLQKAKDLINEKAIDLSAAVHKQNIEAGRQVREIIDVHVPVACWPRDGDCLLAIEECSVKTAPNLLRLSVFSNYTLDKVDIAYVLPISLLLYSSCKW
jgi:hypothetical protein